MTSTIALVQGPNKNLVKTQVTLPPLGPGQGLVKVAYVAQNPTDVQSLDRDLLGEGAVLGCDFAGTVEEVGPHCTDIQVGDKVAGLIWGGEIKGLGGYSEHTIVDEKICFKIPPMIPSEAAATIPLAACTAWLALFSKDCLAIPRDGPSTPSVLIWGGSSNPRNFDTVKSYGANHVFDYNDPEVVDKIKGALPSLHYIFDTIGDKTSSGLSAKALNNNSGVLCTVRPGKNNTEEVPSNVKITEVLVWTAFLKDHSYKDFFWPDHQLAIELFKELPNWLVEGKIRPNTVHLLEGMENVPKGFQMYRDGSISSFKIVYRL